MISGLVLATVSLAPPSYAALRMADAALPRIAVLARTAVLPRTAVFMTEPTEPAAPTIEPAAATIETKLKRSTSNKGVLNLVEKNVDTISADTCAVALRSLAAINKKQRAGRDALLRDARFEQLLRSLMDRSSELSARSVSDVLWSLATLQHLPSVRSPAERGTCALICALVSPDLFPHWC